MFSKQLLVKGGIFFIPILLLSGCESSPYFKNLNPVNWWREYQSAQQIPMTEHDTAYPQLQDITPNIPKQDTAQEKENQNTLHNLAMHSLTTVKNIPTPGTASKTIQTQPQAPSLPFSLLQPPITLSFTPGSTQLSLFNQAMLLNFAAFADKHQVSVRAGGSGLLSLAYARAQTIVSALEQNAVPKNHIHVSLLKDLQNSVVSIIH